MCMFPCVRIDDDDDDDDDVQVFTDSVVKTGHLPLQSELLYVSPLFVIKLYMSASFSCSGIRRRFAATINGHCSRVCDGRRVRVRCGVAG